MFRTWIRAFVFGAVLSAAAVGCNRRQHAAEAPPAEVFGTVSMGGRPLSQGTVTFVPKISEREGGQPGVARIDAGGGYRIGNANPEKRRLLKPGDYVVTVLAMAPGVDEKNPAPRLLVPEEYTDSRRSRLRATVRTGENRVDLDLTP